MTLPRHRRCRHPRAHHLALKPTLLSLAVAACFPANGIANPTDPSVVVGSARFEQAGHSLTVTNSPGAVIEWRGFSVGVGEITRFAQQSAASSVLNRVTGQDPSQILGRLESNGQVFLINPNGILFGREAVVDVGALVASTLPLSNADFAAGRLNFGLGSGGIHNQGLLQSVAGGRIYLVAQDVQNHGIIRAPDGQVLLAAGSQVNLVDSYRPDIQVSLSAPAGGEALNVGQLVGGQVGIYAAAIRQQGTVQATGAQVGAGGEIIFSASRTLDVAPGASLSADGLAGGRIRLQAGDTALVAGTVSATGSAGTGGRVELLGRNVGVLDGARIDASGSSGGGHIRIGGDRLGQGELPRAQQLRVEAGVSIRADATTRGDGGDIVLWSEARTDFAGGISARGGPGGGRGGEAEVSSRGVLSYTGWTDLRAPLGAWGTLLLDPFNIFISSATQTTSPGFTPNANDSVINAATLVTALGGAHVTVSTGLTGSPGSQAGNITLSVPLTWSSASILTLQAANHITLNGAVTASAGGLTLQAGSSSSINANGAISVGRFELVSGNWTQNSASLPGLTATDFRITGGSFLRAQGGDGTIATPYLIGDVYGLQGMASTGLLGAQFKLVDHIDASVTKNWNSGKGFRPVGGVANAF
ncbi:MAG: filamentous hemagglutinin N-terminal domain-containing protein, partial [Rubrivivax sp.]